MLSIASITDPGLVRPRNEDFYLYSSDNRIIIVADGVGGNGYGEVASRIAAENSYSFLESELDIENSEDGEGEAPEKTLTKAIRYANQCVLDAKIDKPAYKSMGTTLTCIYLDDDYLYYSYIGDSRVYHIEAESQTMRLLTNDHTLSKELIDESMAPSLCKYPGSILTRMVGAGISVNPEYGRQRIRKGDFILTCTDGLSDLISSELILSTTLQNRDNLNTCLQALLDLVKENGARDNVSIVLGHYF